VDEGRILWCGKSFRNGKLRRCERGWSGKKQSKGWLGVEKEVVRGELGKIVAVLRGYVPESMLQNFDQKEKQHPTPLGENDTKTITDGENETEIILILRKHQQADKAKKGSEGAISQERKKKLGRWGLDQKEEIAHRKRVGRGKGRG